MSSESPSSTEHHNFDQLPPHLAKALRRVALAVALFLPVQDLAAEDSSNVAALAESAHITQSINPLVAPDAPWQTVFEKLKEGTTLYGETVIAGHVGKGIEAKPVWSVARNVEHNDARVFVNTHVSSADIAKVLEAFGHAQVAYVLVLHSHPSKVTGAASMPPSPADIGSAMQMPQARIVPSQRDAPPVYYGVVDGLGMWVYESSMKEGAYALDVTEEGERVLARSVEIYNAWIQLSKDKSPHDLEELRNTNEFKDLMKVFSALKIHMRYISHDEAAHMIPFGVIGG